MAKIPDFSELTKKIDLHGLVASVKSVVNSVSNSNNPITNKVDGTELDKLFFEISSLLKTVSSTITTVQTKLNLIHKQLQETQFAQPAQTQSTQQPENASTAPVLDNEQNSPLSTDSKIIITDISTDKSETKGN